MVGNLYTVTAWDVEHWPARNFINPENRDWLPAFAIAWQVVATLLVGGRIHLRLRARSGSGAFGYDDALILVAWAFTVAFTASACISVWDNDIGRHIWDVPLNRYQPALYWAYIAQVTFIFGTAATKISILLFYRRMVKDTFGRNWIYAVWALIAFTILSTIGCSIAYFLMCIPLHVYWDIHTLEALGEGHFNCLSGDALTIATGIVTIFVDFWTAALPCIMFHTHNIGVSKRQKIALDVIFCLGFFVTGAGIARTYYLWRIGHHEDLSWIGYDLFVASVVELELAIICVCLPFVRAFARRYFPDLATIRSTSGMDSGVAVHSHGTAEPTSTYASSQHTQPRDSYVPMEKLPYHDEEAAEEKSGVMMREPQTGLLKPVWSNKRVSIRQSLRPQATEFT